MRTLSCIECRRSYDLDDIRYRCDCGGLLEVLQPLDRMRGTVTRETFAGRSPFGSPFAKSGVWRYRELILDIDEGSAVSLGEGNTGLYRMEAMERACGVGEIHLKHEGLNPTGSFKDRGMTVGISYARSLGISHVACASTGNTSASLAAYAARAGMTCSVLIPRGKIAVGKLTQAMAFGARIYEVDGDFDDAMRAVSELCGRRRIYLLNSLNPFRLEGQKSIIFETLEQLGWESPDWLVLPGGNLGNTSAFHKAFRELLDLGLIAKIPRMAVIQAAGASPLYDYYSGGFTTYRPVRAETVATAIRIGDPVNVSKARRAVEETRGLVEKVTDEEILEAKAEIDAAGLGCEPASAASLAGLRKLAGRGEIGKGDRVVALLTGNLLKDTDAVMRYHSGPDRVGARANPPRRIRSVEDIEK